jgi:hypothetical protein
MKFGKSAEEAAQEPSRGGGDGQSFMKYLKAGDNFIHVVDEPDKWVYYWEHYNPGGYPFPCTNDRDTCNGCISDDEKMSKASRKIAFNAYDGEYTNVWKVPKTVADKLKMRYERNGTVTDRPFIVTQFKKDNGFYDYDVEGQDKASLPKEVNDYTNDPEILLAQAWDEAWGDSTKVKQTSAKAKQASKEEDLQSQINQSKAKLSIARDEPKEEPKKVTEADLRKMEPWDLVALCEKEGYGEVPSEHAKDTDSIVDWMLKQ